jgi:TonB family protein
VSQTLQLDRPVEVREAPKLVVEWSSPWREFVDSIGPALARSDRRLAGEAPFGLIPLRVMIPSYVLEAFLIFAAIVIQVKVAELRPYVTPRISSHDVIYFSGEELPRTEDLGGAEAGATGRAGGDEAHHRTQTIKIARGGSLVSRVVDAPNLKLPSSRDAVANLLAIRPNPGPPPSEGMRSSRAMPNLGTTLVAPAPNAIRDYTRNGVQLNSVIAPAPSASRDRSTIAPTLNANAIPPAPSVSNDHTLVAPALAPTVIAPAPSTSRDRMLTTPSLAASVVAPSPSASRDRSRSTPALSGSVIPPAPGGVSREVSSSPVQMSNAAVIPPPVSAPERASTRNPKLSLSAPSVIAPPPSTDVSQDTHRLAGGNIPDPTKSVVPPPPTQSGSGSFMSSLVGKIFGATEVVPPPPAVNSDGRSNPGTSLSGNVVVPPPSVATSGSPSGARNGMGSAVGSNVVAPPPSAGVSAGTGSRAHSSSTQSLGAPSVVPPPPALSTTGGAGAGGRGTLLANNVVPPPPSLAGGSNSAGSGLGRNGAGLGAPLDAGSNLAKPTSGGSGATAGTVMSTQAGSKLGLPTSGGVGSLAMSPSGGDKTGLGGAGGGTGIGRGDSTGSGLNGAGPGAGKTGAGRGTEPNAAGGISPAPGPGGAGNVPAGAPPVRGVDISGGSSQVTIPAFGSDGSSSEDAQSPGRSAVKPQRSFDVDIVATANSGGAFEPYKNLLHGEKHTIYPETYSSLGTAAMEYAEASAGRGVFSPPQGIRTNLPEGLPHARMVVTCTLDASGNLKGIRVLEAGPADMTAKVLAALRSWKFQPAMRANQPVEVTAILGFGINTNDRF